MRIFRWKNHFEKGYTGYWTTEIFKIFEIVQSSPITYRIKDFQGEDILGKFYSSELQKSEF